MKTFENIIIGGGASGILCAILLKQKGQDVVIIEGSDRILKKVLVTGNGRCNITNIKLKDRQAIDSYFSSSHQNSPKLIPLHDHGFNEIEENFTELGIPLVELEEGKMYPLSLQASSVVDSLRLRISELNIPLITGEMVKDIKKNRSQYNIYTDKETFQCNRVIMATGGLAMPSTGSNGSGHRILKNLGLEIESPLPALVQLKTDYKNLRGISGVKQESSIRLFKEVEFIKEEKGELLFTDYGISGPPILQLSRYCALYRYQNLKVILDLFPDFTKEYLLDFIKRSRDTFKERESLYLLSGILNKKLIPQILRMSGVEKMNIPCSEITDTTLNTIVDILKGWEMNITGHNEFKNAQSTLGGVSLKEVDLNTMETRKYTGMYVLGELLDVCGACGGYNLSWAFSTAITCASAIAKSK